MPSTKIHILDHTATKARKTVARMPLPKSSGYPIDSTYHSSARCQLTPILKALCFVRLSILICPGVQFVTPLPLHCTGLQIVNFLVGSSEADLPLAYEEC